jgi:hypothetical protein
LENENPELLTAKANFITKANSRLEDPIKDHLELNKLVKISLVTLSKDESINFNDMTYDPEAMDSYLTAEVLLHKGDKIKFGKVVCCLTDANYLPYERTILSLTHKDMLSSLMMEKNLNMLLTS